MESASIAARYVLNYNPLWNKAALMDSQTLSSLLVDEIFKALGLSSEGWARRRLGGIFAPITRRLADIGVTFDRLVRDDGFSQAAAWALTNFCKGVRALGTEHVPKHGPLLVISNHPGAYDALVITSNLHRDDIKIISSDIPFLKNLPHLYQNFLFISQDTHERMGGARGAIRHLREGGAVLLYATGKIDPDPATFPNPEAHIDRWSPSIDLFLRVVPETQTLLTIVSGVLSHKWGYSPLTRLRRQDMDKRRLAEFGQVMQQLLFPGKTYYSPQVSFAAPFLANDLRAGSPGGRLLPEITTRGRALLKEHKRFFGLAPATGESG
jgi:hypothetical protein